MVYKSSHEKDKEKKKEKEENEKQKDREDGLTFPSLFFPLPLPVFEVLVWLLLVLFLRL